MKTESAGIVVYRVLSAVILTVLMSNAHAADLQAKTTDGQVIQGEYLGSENDIVRLKTSYGVVSIPSKNIVTLLAVNSPDKAAPGTAPAKGEDINVDALVFKEPKNVVLSSLLAARMPRIPEPDVRSRLELFRCIRNFGDSSDASRQRIVRTLSGFGLMAYPFIEGAYNGPNELQDKVELIQAVTGTRKPYSAQIFASVHAAALNDISRAANEAPQLPYESLAPRNAVTSREQRLKNLARDIRLIEGYASASGGPFNALFLMGIYKSRYSGDADALLKNLTLDRIRLAGTASNFKDPRSGWTSDDRVLLIELVFPLYFKDNADLKSIAESFLKNLIPDHHPEWDAPQAEWFQWWSKQRSQILKAK
ncbi:MAG: hypothetical protein WCT04_17330 [Planctomycetota bacterium]